MSASMSLTMAAAYQGRSTAADIGSSTIALHPQFNGGVGAESAGGTDARLEVPLHR